MNNKVNPNSTLQLEGGYKRIAIGRRTYSRLKQYAGRETFSVAVKQLLDNAGKSKQVPAAGFEREVSDNTMPAISTKLNAVISILASAYKLDEAFLKAVGITGEWSKDTPHIPIAEALSRLDDKARSLPSFEVTQRGLFDNKAPV